MYHTFPQQNSLQPKKHLHQQDMYILMHSLRLIPTFGMRMPSYKRISSFFSTRRVLSLAAKSKSHKQVDNNYLVPVVSIGKNKTYSLKLEARIPKSDHTNIMNKLTKPIKCNEKNTCLTPPAIQLSNSTS